MRKSCLCAGIVMLAMGLFGVQTGFTAPPASQAVQAAEVHAVHTAEFKDVDGNTIKVVTFSDGTVSVSVNGGPMILGAAATQTLASHGITVSVASDGKISNVATANGAKVTQPARPVTQSEARTANAGRAAAAEAPQAAAVAPSMVTRAPAFAVMPANIATGSGSQTQQIQHQTQPSTPATGTPNSR